MVLESNEGHSSWSGQLNVGLSLDAGNWTRDKIDVHSERNFQYGDNN